MASDELLLMMTATLGRAFMRMWHSIRSLASMMFDMKSLRYITSPNQSISDSKNHHPGIDNNGPFLAMNPFSSRCCQHNHGQGWPYYIEHLIMATSDNGIAAAIFELARLRRRDGNRRDAGSNHPVINRGHQRSPPCLPLLN